MMPFPDEYAKYFLSQADQVRFTLSHPDWMGEYHDLHRQIGKVRESDDKATLYRLQKVVYALKGVKYRTRHSKNQADRYDDPIMASLASYLRDQ